MQLSLSEAENFWWMVNRNDWLGVQGFARRMMRAGAPGLLKRYRRAVDRIAAHFRDSFFRSPWSSEWSPDKIQEHRQIIAWFCHEFGSAGPLIADITDVREKGHSPRSLLYFIVTDRGRRASRWDKLLGEKRQAEWQQFKSTENTGAKQSTAVTDIMAPAIKKLSTGSVKDLAHKMMIRAARSDFNAAVKRGDTDAANQVRNKIHALTGVDIANQDT